MYNLNTKKINISDAKPNMILAKNVVSNSGNIILAKNTMISDINYNKLKDMGIKYITIFEKDDNINDSFDEDVLLENKECEKIEDRKEFKQFKKVYEDKIEKLENQFIAIGKGVGVEIDNLYSMVIDIVDSVNCKNDVFSYLGHLKSQDIHTYAHCLNVSLICNLFGLWLGYSGDDLKILTVAGILHDIGKTQVDENIIKKPEKLTEVEYDHIKKHAYLGYNIVKNLNIPEEIKLGVLMHHEKIDGSGYPLGLTNNKISSTAKIIAICDIYEAMTADRVYRPKICPFEVIRNFEQNSYELLDTPLLLAFLQNIVYTYVGSQVMLSDGRKAEVVFINQANLSKPIVKCCEDFIDLSQEKDLYIKHIL
ncbi:HD-GYP domain-containing protein [uncultured Tyzzerella sp.]|uniref:HD-GYP domain-containing protein n=1 Tax=uncultured Tyzzerella sp. TaxID=2321398 RepID=UPI0029420A86|nr:HD-GYP domain-containing protein [uncultured Tyzzerella sp.]